MPEEDLARGYCRPPWLLRNPLPPASPPIKGWRPARLPDGSWGSLYVGRNPKALPIELAGLTITVRARSGKSWDAIITEVLE